jgi:hypothetical protein
MQQIARDRSSETSLSKGNAMAPTDAPPAAADDERLGPIGRFAAKTVIVAAAVTVAAWIIIGQIFDRLDLALDRGTQQLNSVVIRGTEHLDAVIDRGTQRLSARIQSATRIGGRSFWARLEKELDSAASPSNDIPPEKQRKLLADLRIIVARWRPFIMEGSKLFSDNPATETAVGKK